MSNNITISRMPDSETLLKVEFGDRYADNLCWEEMIGLVIEITSRDGKPMMSWLRTEVQHIEWNKQFEQAKAQPDEQ